MANNLNKQTLIQLLGPKAGTKLFTLLDSCCNTFCEDVLACVAVEGFLPMLAPAGAPQNLAGPGAADITSYETAFTSTGTGDAITLADGAAVGQVKKILYVAEAAGGDTGVITLTGYTSITLNAIGDYAVVQWNGTAWLLIDSLGATVV